MQSTLRRQSLLSVGIHSRVDSILGCQVKRLRRRIYNALWSLNRWLTEDDTRNTYFVCALVFVAALTLAGLKQFESEPPQVLVFSALEWS